MLLLEQKRTERSNKGFILLLVDFSRLAETPDVGGTAQEGVLRVLSQSTRETDVRGWYETSSIAGAIFTEIDRTHAPQVIDSLRRRIVTSLLLELTPELSNQIEVRLHIYPADHDPNLPADRLTDQDRIDPGKVTASITKRVIDICGGVFGLLIFAPVILAIAAFIKLTSRGPVFFRQDRVGRHGKVFTFLKFRTMYVGTDQRIHEEYTAKLIAGEANSGENAAVYKLVADPRITPFGRLLRKSSLDELPQFLNIIRGEMSLVGPRPPVTYEFNNYALWHRQRIYAAKPGLTGLWQVEGRSTVSFDDMVRLDIRYARSWSLWLDIKILLRTPRAVISARGAY